MNLNLKALLILKKGRYLVVRDREIKDKAIALLARRDADSLVSAIAIVKCVIVI